MNPHKSGRGHDFDGGGAGVGNGQLAQAQDRNFEACFERCRCAVRNIADVDPAYAVAAHKELQDLTKQVAGMLESLEHLFHEGTAKTIVSLKQLCVQLEVAELASAETSVPLPLCARLCGGAAAVEQRATAGLVEVRKTVKTYAISMLIEHGFRAGDLANFAKGGVGAGQGGQDQEGQAGTPKPLSSERSLSLSSERSLSEGKLVRAASSGMIM